jgi:hypothetical protein
MNKLDKLIQKWNIAKEKVDDSRNALEDYLFPIIKALNPGKTIYTISSIRAIRAGGPGYRIETIDSRDEGNWRDYTIPYDIMEAKDPLKLAQERAAGVELANQSLQQARIKAEIERLQGLLK